MLLGFESSAKSASVALLNEGLIIAQSFQNCGLTHSKTLLPMAEDLLKNAGLNMADIETFAVSHGPGSFTGIRIGVSCVKGLCWALEKPAIGVSTLEAMAYNALGFLPGSVICCCMDARRNEIYNALFTFEGGRLIRLCADRAISLENLSAQLMDEKRQILLIGDGAELAYNFLKEKAEVALAPQSIRLQKASGVCLAANGRGAKNADQIIPVYLRLSQAERERLEKVNKE